MSWEQTKEVAELIVLRMEEGSFSQAMKLWELAEQEGVDFDKLESAIFEARYGAMIPG